MYVAQGRNFLDDRVDVVPSPSLKDRHATVRYEGILQKSGADRVFIRYGFDGWHNSADTEMRREPDGSFTCSIPMQGQRECNFCFKDSANNWDNNDGWNWATDIRY